MSTNTDDGIEFYRYLNVKNAIKIIEENKLRLGRIGDFNDPFEALLKGYYDKGNFLDQSTYLCCFSRAGISEEDIIPSCDILLWSHYAEKHQGVRIRFKSFRSYLNKEFTYAEVRYQKERWRVDLQNKNNKSDLELFQLLFVKSECWKYEQECRLLFIKDKKDWNDGKTCKYIFLNDKFFIKSIDLGVRCSLGNQQEIKGLVEKHSNNIILRKAEINASQYSLEYHEIPIKRVGSIF
jgi:hypothetical protein